MLAEVTDLGVVAEVALALLKLDTPARIFSSVDLPAPFGPTSTVPFAALEH